MKLHSHTTKDITKLANQSKEAVIAGLKTEQVLGSNPSAGSMKGVSMTPGEVRDELATIQANLRKLEETVERQKSANVGYHNVCYEITEGWDAIERAIESCDEMVMGVT